MKKSFALLAILIVSLSSCKKNYCWKCTIMTGYRGSTNTPPATIVRTTVCDKTEQEIKAYEQSMKATATSGNITVTQSATCSKQ